MRLHANAALTLKQRERMVRRVVDAPLLPRPEPPERRRGEMTEDRPLAAREDRGAKAAAQRRAAMADRVHTAIQAVQPPVAVAPLDRMAVQAARAQLRDRQHPVALGGELGDTNAGGCVWLMSSSDTGSTHPPRHDPIVAPIM